jgi:hypothetical protein
MNKQIDTPQKSGEGEDSKFLKYNKPYKISKFSVTSILPNFDDSKLLAWIT